MNKSLAEILAGNLRREVLLDYLEKKPECFDDAIKLALENDEILSWRATWLLNQTAVKNDKRLNTYTKKLIESVNGKRDGHQRELLKLIQKMDIDEEIEGYLFDICMTIWEDVDKIPSVRITAFRIIVDTAKKYPELINEIEFLAQEHFAETLSYGIKNSFERIKKELNPHYS